MLPVEGSRDKPVVVFLETAFLDYFSSLNKVIKLIQRFSKRFNEKLISRKKLKKRWQLINIKYFPSVRGA